MAEEQQVTEEKVAADVKQIANEQVAAEVEDHGSIEGRADGCGGPLAHHGDG